MSKTAAADHDIHHLLKKRWSPRAFSPAPVSHEVLLRLLEAARWSPSSNNEQPWAFIVSQAEDAEGFQAALRCLVEFNHGWAQHAPLLIFTLARREFAANGRVNNYAWHDVGLAVSQLVLQATHEGLGVHQLGGILHDQIRTTFNVPPEWQTVTGLAIGWPGSAEQLPESLRQKELASRTRKPLSDFVFTRTWKQTPSFIAQADKTGAT